MDIIGWISNIINGKKVQASTTHTTPMTLDQLLAAIGPSHQSSSGVSVTPDAAMRQATVYSCIRLLSETISQLPLHLYERTADGRERAVNHPLYPVLRATPNSYMTASEFWQFTIACVLLRGMSCSYKVMVGNKLKELIPIAPDSIEEIWNGNQRYYSVVLANGKAEQLPPEAIFCVKGMSLDGQTAVSPIKFAVNSIGGAISTEAYSSAFYKNGARPSGLLKTAAVMDETKINDLRAKWNMQHGGTGAGGTAILTAGLEFQPISMSNEDAQLLELLGFQRTEICGIFGVPPHMIGAIEKTSSWGTGLAEQSLSFIKYTIAPWLNRVEQSISRDLLGPADRKKYYPEFLTEQFLRGDTKNRYDSYKIALGGTQNPGFMTPNEIRKLENLPPIEDGDVIYKPEPAEGPGRPDEKQAETQGGDTPAK